MSSTLSLFPSRIPLQQLSHMSGATENFSTLPNSPTSNRTSPLSVLPPSLTSTSHHSNYCPPSYSRSSLLRSPQNYTLDLFFTPPNLRWLLLEASPKSSHPVPSITNRLPPLFTPHQFGSKLSHYFQLPISLNHSAHTNTEQTIHAIPCSSNGVSQVDDG